MKKHYTLAEMEVINLENEDIIKTSGDVLCGEQAICAESGDWGCDCHGTPGMEK